jgi:N-acetylglucosamine kinase-like BadF-type ATPase
LAGVGGHIVADGAVSGCSATQLSSETGITALRTVFEDLAKTIPTSGRILQVQACITGYGGQAGETSQLLAIMSAALKVAPQSIALSNDIELAYRDIFQPGEGYLVYAGTGSIAAFIDEEGAFHRAGGRGVTLDDGGGGFWIAREALRDIWRKEDESPGSWRQSVLAQHVFQHIGSSDWAATREFVYHQARGEVGKLALAVAAAAAKDHHALYILQEAGRELARLANAMCARYGPRPIALAGRVPDLHPAIAATMRANLPAELEFRQSSTLAHYAAARLAAKQAAGVSE